MSRNQPSVGSVQLAENARFSSILLNKTTGVVLLLISSFRVLLMKNVRCRSWTFVLFEPIDVLGLITTVRKE